MESKNEDIILQLMGNITDYKSELSENDDIEGENESKSYVEKYFHSKLENQFEAKMAFTNIKIDIQKCLEEVILYLNYKLIKNDNLSSNQTKDLIKKLDDFFKNETLIEIDSLFPNIKGNIINKFFQKIKDQTYPINLKVEDELNYTIIVESTFSLKSQIIKKTDQLRKAFLFFSVIDKFYKSYPEYFNIYYKFFIEKYILKEKIEKKVWEFNDDNQIDLSTYGNYVFIIASDKTYKSFKEIEYFANYFDYEENEIDNSVAKCFSFPNFKKKDKVIKKKIYFKESYYEEYKTKILKNPNLCNAYKTLNYLIDNINKQNNCRVLLLYLDTYLNLLTPKPFIIGKLEEINNKLNDYYKKEEKENNKINNEIKRLKDENNNLNKNFSLSQKELADTKKELADTKKRLAEAQKDFSETKTGLNNFLGKFEKGNEKVNELINFLSQKFPEFNKSKFK